MKIVVAAFNDGDMLMEQYETSSVMTGLTRFVTEKLGIEMSDLELEDDAGPDELIESVGENGEVFLDYLIVT